MCSTDCAISSVASAKQSALHTQIAVALAAKRLDAQEQQGAAVVKLLESVAQAGKAAGRGESFDAVA